MKREEKTSDVGAALAEARRQLRPAPFGYIGPGAGGLAGAGVSQRAVPAWTWPVWLSGAGPCHAPHRLAFA